MYYWYFTELDRASGLHVNVHKVKVPDVNDPHFYRQVCSLNAFLAGKRRNATKKQRLTHQASCGYGPAKSFIGYREDDWKRELESNARFLKIIPKGEDYTKLPVIEHENIFDFQSYIGFNRKTRRYEA